MLELAKYKSIVSEHSRHGRLQQLMSKALADKDAQALAFLLEHEEGRWFLARLFFDEGLTANTFTGNSATFFNEGRRAVVGKINERIRSEFGVNGIKLLHQAELELLEFQTRAEEMAQIEIEED